ncbi:MAG: iron ABC transporter permease [bacterium]|nr:iron ABC transporter permease [bacterium]
MLHSKSSKYILLICVLIVLLFFVSVISLCVGSAQINFSNIFNILFYQHNTWQYSVLTELRLPRIILGFAVGGSLGLAGALLQGVFRNPLVEPYTLGISGGASLGVSLVIVLQLSSIFGLFILPLAGFIGSLITMFFVYFLSAKKGVLKINSLLLTGVMISFISSSMVMLIMSVARPEALHSIIFWIMGSLSQPNNNLILIAFIVSVIGLIISYFFCIRLNGLALGEDEARNLGINTASTRKWVFLIASLLTGLSVSVAGVIGFVGLVVPHMIRLYTGPDHRILLLASFLTGAIFLIVSDTIARVIISPLELPVGVITGIIGGVIFVYALNKKRMRL